MKLRHALLIATALSGTAFAQITVLDETFPAGERTTLNPPATAAWYSSGSASNLTYTDLTSITQATGTSGRHLLGYFTADGSPVSLAVGDSLTLQFSITFNRASALGSASNNFRIGLFDSTAGTRVAIDSHGGTSASTTFDGYTGYAAMMNVGAAATGHLTLRERTSTSNQALIAQTTPYTTLGSSGGPAQALAPNVTYTGTFTLSRTGATTTDLLFALSGGTLSGYTISTTDSTTALSAFDMFVFNVTSNTADSFSISDVNVSHTQIPEPSTYAALAGLLALGLVAWRRRQGVQSAA